MKFFKKLQSVTLVKLFKLERLEKPLLFSVVIASFVVLNLLLSTLALRLDLSKGKAYTLSNSSKNLLKKVDDIISIKFFVSGDLPTRLLPLKTDVTDFLKEYERANNKIRVQIIDPKKDANALTQAKEAGIPELQFSQVEQDQYAVTTAYLGLSVTYGTKTETIPQVTDLESLEYNLTSIMYRLTQKELPKIGIIGNENALLNPEGNPTRIFTTLLGGQFTVEAATLATDASNLKYKAVVVYDNIQTEFSDEEIKTLQTYLDNKGKVILVADTIWVSEDFTATPAKHNLGKLTSAYGIKQNSDLVLSLNSEVVNFGTDTVSYLTEYPFWVKTNEFNTAASYFSNVQVATFPWVSSLTLDKKKKDYEVRELILSTPNSWNQKDPFTLQPQAITQPQQKDLKQFILAAESKKKNGGHLVWVGSSRFLQDQFLSRGTGNLDFVLNILNDVASDGALSGIRQRAVNFYPVPELPDTQKDLFKYGNILLLPALFAVYGAFRIFKRK